MKKILTILFFTLVTSLFTYSDAQTPYVDFDSLSSGMTSPGAYVLSLAFQNDTIPFSPLYAGGHFKVAGGDTAVNIAEWVNTSHDYNYPNIGKWVSLGTGIDSDVCALSMFDSCLYAGGKFDTAGGIAVSHIARWDTATHKWDSLKGQLNGNVYALCVYNGALYVGGDFTIADGDTVNRIAVWHDSVWAPVGKGFDTGAVYALTVSNDSLYAGGSFIKSNGVVVNHIARLSGNKWDSLGSGTNNTVYALADVQQLGGLYVGGAFTKSGGIHTNYISVYYNSKFRLNWDSVGPGVNDTVRALGSGYYPIIVIDKPSVNSFEGNMLLAGGNFDRAQGFADKYLTDYYYIDSVSPLTGPVYAIAAQAPYFNYIGGKFNSATNNPDKTFISLNNVGILNFVDLPGGINNLSYKSDITAYPNPSGGVFTLQVKSEEVGANSNVEVYNMLGEKVYTNYQITKSSNYQIDLSSQPNGVYLYRVMDDNGGLIGEGKLVIER